MIHEFGKVHLVSGGTSGGSPQYFIKLPGGWPASRGQHVTVRFGTMEEPDSLLARYDGDASDRVRVKAGGSKSRRPHYVWIKQDEKNRLNRPIWAPLIHDGNGSLTSLELLAFATGRFSRSGEIERYVDSA